MANLKERLIRLEAKVLPTTPLDIVFHVISVVTHNDERRGTWREHLDQSPFPMVTFYATSAIEFEALREQYRNTKNSPPYF